MLFQIFAVLVLCDGIHKDHVAPFFTTLDNL